MNSPGHQRLVDIADPRLQWTSIDALSTDSGLDHAARAWLTAPGSLTRLLKASSAGQFRVEVQEEGQRTVDSLELRAEFGPLAPDHGFWSRRVMLLGDEQPWVLAHTLLPAHSQLSPLAQVISLGSKPLGEFLFEHPQLHRGDMQVAHLQGRIWGRKSLFFLFGKPIMVAEFFLPALLSRDVPAL